MNHLIRLAQTTDANIKKLFGEGVKDAPLSGGSISDTFSFVLGFLINIVFFVSGLAVLVMLMWGAMDYIMSAGDKTKIEKAVGKMTSAVIGMLILIFVLVIWVFLSTKVFRTNFLLPTVQDQRAPAPGQPGPKDTPAPQ